MSVLYPLVPCSLSTAHFSPEPPGSLAPISPLYPPTRHTLLQLAKTTSTLQNHVLIRNKNTQSWNLLFIPTVFFYFSCRSSLQKINFEVETKIGNFSWEWISVPHQQSNLACQHPFKEFKPRHFVKIIIT